MISMSSQGFLDEQTALSAGESDVVGLGAILDFVKVEIAPMAVSFGCIGNGFVALFASDGNGAVVGAGFRNIGEGVGAGLNHVIAVFIYIPFCGDSHLGSELAGNAFSVLVYPNISLTSIIGLCRIVGGVILSEDLGEVMGDLLNNGILYRRFGIGLVAYGADTGGALQTSVHAGFNSYINGIFYILVLTKNIGGIGLVEFDVANFANIVGVSSFEAGCILREYLILSAFLNCGVGLDAIVNCEVLAKSIDTTEVRCLRLVVVGNYLFAVRAVELFPTSLFASRTDIVAQSGCIVPTQMAKLGKFNLNQLTSGFAGGRGPSTIVLSGASSIGAQEGDRTLSGAIRKGISNYIKFVAVSIIVFTIILVDIMRRFAISAIPPCSNLCLRDRVKFALHILTSSQSRNAQQAYQRENQYENLISHCSFLLFFVVF